MTVVVDCNIWISLTINSELDFIVKLANNGVQIASCGALRKEITEVLKRPKLQRFIPYNVIGKVAKLHDLLCVQYQITNIEHVVRDIKDDYLFALCKQSKADYLVTGDKLLLAVEQYKSTKVISLADFRALIYN